MEICELKYNDEKKWDEYVLKHPESTFYHQISWKNIVQNSYGHIPYYLLAKEGDKIKGVFPLFLMKNLIFGTKLVSVPFAPYGGAISDNSAIEDLLIGYGRKITDEISANYMELRNNVSKNLGLPCSDKYLTMILKLDKDPQLVWQRDFNNKIRNAAKKSLKSELEVSDSNVEDFYELYSKNMRDLGSPSHSKEFFNNVILESGKLAEIISVSHRGKPVSAAILLYFKDTVISGWAASDRIYNKLNPNNLLYWTAIKQACENGYQYFDFGRSIYDSGTYNFKKPWGVTSCKLQYAYYLKKSKIVPDTSQSNMKRKKFAKVWSKMPLSLTNYIGPKLRGEFP